MRIYHQVIEEYVSMNPWEKLKTLSATEREKRLVAAREAAIAEKAASGSQYGRIVERGIRSGQWDGGSVVGKHLF